MSCTWVTGKREDLVHASEVQIERHEKVQFAGKYSEGESEDFFRGE
jgi:hypothetical protein